MSELRFSLDRTTDGLEGKQGILRPDSEGYYEILAGAYNVENSNGEIYTFTDKVRMLFEVSEARRWQKAGKLIAEQDHPARSEFMQAGLSNSRIDALWKQRLATLKGASCAGLIRDFRFAKLPDKVNGRDVFGVFISIKPVSEYLKASLGTKDSNTCMSVRSLVNRMMDMGKWLRETTDLFTWDHIPVGGIGQATKWSSPALESESLILTPGDYREFADMERLELAATPGLESSSVTPLLTTMIKHNGAWIETPDVGHLAMNRWD